VHKSFTIVALAALFILSACQTPAPLSETEQIEFINTIDPIVENALTGLSDNNYDQHVRDFSKDLQKQVDPITFPRVYDEIIGALGAYQGRELVGVEDLNRQVAVIYEAQFENDPQVAVRVVFWKNDPEHQIAGLWFDSELLPGQ
jgi:hypothetical protein